MSEKTVFLSYRRDVAGKAFARSLAEALTHRGYDVFLDVDSIDAGRWAEQIATQVAARAHFLLLLTPRALDRCADEGDWVRREYERHDVIDVERRLLTFLGEPAVLATPAGTLDDVPAELA